MSGPRQDKDKMTETELQTLNEFIGQLHKAQVNLTQQIEQLNKLNDRPGVKPDLKRMETFTSHLSLLNRMEETIDKLAGEHKGLGNIPKSELSDYLGKKHILDAEVSKVLTKYDAFQKMIDTKMSGSLEKSPMWGGANKRIVIPKKTVDEKEKGTFAIPPLRQTKKGPG